MSRPVQFSINFHWMDHFMNLASPVLVITVCCISLVSCTCTVPACVCWFLEVSMTTWGSDIVIMHSKHILVHSPLDLIDHDHQACLGRFEFLGLVHDFLPLLEFCRSLPQLWKRENFAIHKWISMIVTVITIAWVYPLDSNLGFLVAIILCG